MCSDWKLHRRWPTANERADTAAGSSGRSYRPEYLYFNRYIYNYIKQKQSSLHIAWPAAHCKIISLPSTLFVEHTILAQSSASWSRLPNHFLLHNLYFFLSFSLQISSQIGIASFLQAIIFNNNLSLARELRSHTRVILRYFLITSRVCLVVKRSLRAKQLSAILPLVKSWAAFGIAYSMSRYLISISTYLTSAKRVGTL